MTRHAPALALVAIALFPAPAAATIGATAEASAALAKQLGAARATFNLDKGKVRSEEWQLADPGWPQAQGEEALRQLTGTSGAFAKRDPQGGNLWLTGPGGHVGMLNDGKKTTFLMAYAAGSETQVHTGPSRIWSPAWGLRDRGATPGNVALLKPGMPVDDATFLLGNWDAPNEVQHVTPKALTWNFGGKPKVRLHLDKDGAKIVKVQKL